MEGALRYRLPIFVLPCPDYVDAIEREGTTRLEADPSDVVGRSGVYRGRCSFPVAKFSR